MSDKQLMRQSSMKKPGRPDVKKKNRHVLIRVPDSDSDRPYKLKTKILITALAVLVFVSGLSGYIIGSADSARREIPDPVEPPKPSASRLHVFQRAAVCTDSKVCSKIGKDILAKNGSAVDAAISAMFCNGLQNMQSMGIGGGFFMTVYLKNEEKTYVVNAREKAPAAAHVDMFQDNPDKAIKGSLAVGVPGELRGMWAAHKRWGKLPWESLITPSIEMCKNGYVMSESLYNGLLTNPSVKNDPHLRKMYFNSAKGDYYKPGSIVKPADALCTTLERIAKNGADDLYTGALANEFLDDLQRIGSIVTAEDLRNYEPLILEPIAVPLMDGDILYTPPPPASGLILVNILNILSGYNFTAASIKTTEDKILTYHRIIEAFKFAYSTRTKIGDIPGLDELIKKVSNPEYGAEVRLRINDTSTSNNSATYGAEMYSKPDAGTAHISIIDANGDAVSVTSSINYYFGAGFSTLKTGIVMNNVMDDFSSPGFANQFGLRPSSANFIAPHKRPLSSMAPSIIVDASGNAKFVVGAAGGTRITTAIALVTMRKLWFDQSIKEAVDEPRFHHQITPMVVDYEFGIIEDILNGLRAKGHGFERLNKRGSIVCALFRNQTGIYANADWRKGGDVSGE